MAKKVKEQLFSKDRPNPPEEVEEELLEKFTEFCEDRDTQDLTASQFISFLEEYLRIPHRLLTNVRPEDYVIEGTDVIGFEEYLSKAGLLVVMRNNVREIDSAWRLFVRHSRDKSGDIYAERIHLDDLVVLQQKLNDTTPKSLLTDMVAIATNGRRPYVTYADFAVIMGKLGELAY